MVFPMKVWDLVPTGIARIVRSFGWSPIGRKITLTIGETGGEVAMGTRYEGTITAVNQNATAAIQLSNQTTMTVRARHVGYDLYYLAIGSIAVHVYRSESENAFAAGILKLSR
jgi:hypothetical protein